MFICFGAAVEALIIGGMATFGAKLIQEKFNVDITYAGTLMGMIQIAKYSVCAAVVVFCPSWFCCDFLC